MIDFSPILARLRQERLGVPFEASAALGRE